MKWFKHYANAHTNKMIQALIAEPKGLENAMRYWLLLELLCSEFKKSTTIFEVSTKQLKDALHIKFDKKLTTFCQLLTNFSQTFDQESVNFTQTSENFWKIETRIILDLMGKEFVRTRTDRGSAAAKKKEKEIEEELEEEKKESPPLRFSKLEITPSEIIELYNSNLSGHGKLKTIPSFDMAPNSVKNFQILSGFQKYQNLKGWSDYFQKVRESDFLTGRKGKGGCATLNWLLDPNNAEKVNQGQYQNDTDEIATSPSLDFLDEVANGN